VNRPKIHRLLVRTLLCAARREMELHRRMQEIAPYAKSRCVRSLLTHPSVRGSPQYFQNFLQIFLGSRSRFIENSSPYGSIGLKVRQVEGVSNQDFTKHRVSLRTLTYVCVIASWGV
jgi:hypothetical protein